MKTILTIQKNILSKLTRVLMFIAIICFGFKANAQCMASYTSSIDPANNGGVTFTYTGTWLGMGSSTYYWDFGDGGSSLMSNPGTYTYSSTGTYTVCMTLTDTASGCYDIFCSTISVINTTGSASCSASFIAYDSSGYTYFQNTSSGSNLISSWSFGDGNTGVSTGDIVYNYSTPGYYYACLNISDTLGTCVSYFCDTIFINYVPSGSCLGIVDPTFSSVDSLGYGIFSNTPTGPGQSYFWDFGDGMTGGTVGNTSHLYTANGTYFVCLNVYDASDSCQYCSFINIGSSVSCNAYFYTYTDSTGAVTLNNVSSSSGTATYYSWDFGDGTTSTLQNPPPHNYSTSGYYTICLTINDSTTSCNSNYCDTILISSCNSSFTYTPDAIGNGCSFFGSSTGTGSNYFWNFGDGSTSILQNPYHVYATNGYYIVYLTVTSSVDTACYDVTFQGVPMSGICNAYFVVQQDSSNLYNYFVYNYSSPSGAITYLWDFGDSTTSTLAYPTHTYAFSAPTQLCLTVSDGSGCTDTYCDTITPGLGMSSVFTINVLNPLSVSENETTIASFENYPNPFSDNTTINYAINKDALVSISIVDLIGNVVAELENGNKASGEYSTTWNAENVSEGMYLLQLKVNNDISTKKIIVNR